MWWMVRRTSQHRHRNATNDHHHLGGFGVATQRTINAPADVVWHAITSIDDASSYLTTVSNVERLDGSAIGDPMKVGTKWRETRCRGGAGPKRDGGGGGGYCYNVDLTCTSISSSSSASDDGDDVDDATSGRPRRRTVTVLTEVSGTTSTGSLTVEPLEPSSPSSPSMTEGSVEDEGEDRGDEDDSAAQEQEGTTKKCDDDGEEKERCRLIVSFAMIPHGFLSRTVAFVSRRFLNQAAIRHVKGDVEDIAESCERIVQRQNGSGTTT